MSEAQEFRHEAEEVRADLKRQLREANETIDSLKQRLHAAATDKKIALNPEDALDHQLRTFIQHADATSAMSDREERLMREHDSMRDRCHEAIRRSTASNGLQRFDGGGFENDLTTFISEVSRKCTEAGAYEKLYESERRHAEGLDRTIQRIVAAVADSDSRLNLKLPVPVHPQPAADVSRYITEVEEYIDTLKGAESQVTSLQTILAKETQDLDELVPTMSLTEKLQACCDSVRSSRKAEQNEMREVLQDMARAQSRLKDVGQDARKLKRSFGAAQDKREATQKDNEQSREAVARRRRFGS